MGKIINFSDFSIPKKEMNPFNCMHLEEIEKCRDLLYVQAGLLDAASFYAEDFLRDLSIDPSDFRLSKKSAEDYMDLNFLKFLLGEEDICVDFELLGRKTEYTIEVTITCKNKENFELEGVLFRQSDNGSEVYDAETRCWCNCPY